ncbi:MAG: sigma-70 family RNA polymerase sigma factor [Bacteroidales bacterium]|nr:sigma-70 family RNA polymerase sigma factor [Bacteroidales bacterium]
MKFREDPYYIRMILSGDTAAYRGLVEKHQDLVYTIVHRIISSAEEAEEVAQDVFVKAYNKLSDYKGEAKFSTWLYRIAYNTAVSHTRKRKIEFLAMDEEVIGNHSEEDVQQEVMGLSTEEQNKLIKKALAILPRTDSLMITLFYYHGKDIEEISEIVGLTQSNVKVKLFRIRKRLFKEMNEIIDSNINTVA